MVSVGWCVDGERDRLVSGIELPADSGLGWAMSTVIPRLVRHALIRVFRKNIDFAYKGTLAYKGMPL